MLGAETDRGSSRSELLSTQHCIARLSAQLASVLEDMAQRGDERM